MSIEVKVTEPVANYDGSPLKEGDRDVTYRDLIQMSLNQFTPAEQPDGDDKAKSFRITMAAFRDDVLALSIEDAAYLKDRAAKILSPVAYGQLVAQLEGSELMKALP